METRERALIQRLDLKINTFYNEQLKRDEDVLTFLEKREEKLEASMLQKAEGFQISLQGTIQGVWKADGE